MTKLDRTATTREQARAACIRAHEMAQALVATGKRVRIRCEEVGDDRSLRQNSFYWGVVLKEISDQAQLGGSRWIDAAWNEYFRRRFLGYSFASVQVAGQELPSVEQKLRSMKDLSIAGFNEKLQEIQACAVTELGVRFSVPRWEEYEE